MTGLTLDAVANAVADRLGLPRASSTRTRASIAARLGLPHDASNETLLAALDAKLEAKRAREDDEHLYALAFGEVDSPDNAALSATADDALYAAAFPSTIQTQG